MPWVLQQLMPLFKPLVSRRVKLVPVDTADDFVKAVGYTPIANTGESFAAHAESTVPRARSWLQQNQAVGFDASPRKHSHHRGDRGKRPSQTDVTFELDAFLNFT